MPNLVRLLPLTMCCALLACASAKDDAGGPGSSNLPADSKLRVAEAAEAGGNRELALSMYVAAAQSAPSDVSLQLRCADALMRYGQYPQAKQLLVERLKADPGQVELMRGLGLIYLLSGEPGHAIEMLDLILARKPNDAAALADKGIGMDLLHRHAEAQALYRQALSILPDDPTISHDLALSMMLEGKFAEAQKVLEPFRNADAPARLTTNLDILHATTAQNTQPMQSANGQVNNDEVMAIARALHRGIDSPSATP